MREPNYSNFRNILSNALLWGDTILSQLFQNAALYGISEEAFATVYEGFWDLYTRKGQTAEIPVKKLETLLPLIKLVTPPVDIIPEEGGDPISLVNLPLKGIVRIRIPLNHPAEEKKEGEEGTGEEEVITSAKDSKKGAPPAQAPVDAKK